MKFRAVGNELFHADRRMDAQTDMTKLFTILRTRLKTASAQYWSNGISSDACR
jgi:hypothetical protein